MAILIFILRIIVRIILLPVRLILFLLTVLVSALGVIFGMVGGVLGLLFIAVAIFGGISKVVPSGDVPGMLIVGTCLIAIPQILLGIGAEGLSQFNHLLGKI